MTVLTEKTDEIHQAIPHRPPFLFIDEVVEVTDNSIVVKRKIRKDEPQFEGHYPGNPIMPGVLLCEATFQAGAIYLTKKLNDVNRPEKTPVLSRIQEAKFKQIVRPGDEILIEATMVETIGQFHFMKAKIMCDAKTVMTNQFALALIDEK